MSIEQQLSKPINPKYKHKNKPVIINGCSVSFASTAKSTTEPLAAIKEILLSSYRAKKIVG